MLDEVRVVLPGMSGPGFAHHRVGEVDVLKVSDRLAPTVAAADGLKAFRLTRFVTRHRLPLFVGGIILYGLALLGPDLLVRGRVPASTLLMAGSVLVGWIASKALVESGHRGRRVRAVGWSAAAVAGLGGLLVLAVMAGMRWGPGFVLLQVGIMFGGLTLGNRYLGTATAFSTDGQRRRLSRSSLRGAVLVATDTSPGVAVVIAGEGIRFEGDALLPVSGVLCRDLVELASAAEVELGWTLLRMHADLSGLLRGLAQVRPDDGGRHPWADLPRAWQLAYMFGLVEAMGSATDREALRTQVREASEVAAIAERLDLEQRE